MFVLAAGMRFRKPNFHSFYNIRLYIFLSAWFIWMQGLFSPLGCTLSSLCRLQESAVG